MKASQKKLKSMALAAIKEKHFCLVYPHPTQRALPSLWQELFPRSRMSWDWSAEGDSKVAELWHLREALSQSGEAVYSKFYQGRATFFSRPAFTQLLASLGSPTMRHFRYRETSDLVAAFEEKSPLSTKELKKLSGLVGKDHEKEYQRSLKELFQRAWIVGWGERDDGAFPSLQTGLSRDFFEPEWRAAQNIRPADGARQLLKLCPYGPLQNFLVRLRRELKVPL